ncbi:MAG: hypothetical protein ACFB9N_14635 [Geitlerinemataceae cyanobacterium]
MAASRSKRWVSVRFANVDRGSHALFWERNRSVRAGFEGREGLRRAEKIVAEEGSYGTIAVKFG